MALTPRDAALWGQFALALRADSEFAEPDRTAGAVQACEAAAERALALDRRQPDARLALTQLRTSYGDWLQVERNLRDILADAPRHADTLAALGFVLMAVGRSAEALAANGQAVALEPLSPIYHYRLMYHLWTAGRLGEADRVIDRAIELWPRHPGVWFARVWPMGSTARTDVALARISGAARACSMSPGARDLVCIPRGEDGPRRGRRRRRHVIDVNPTRAWPGLATVVTLAGPPAFDARLLDEAFVADGYLLRHGPAVTPLRAQPGQTLIPDQVHRKTQMLFVPVCAPMRGDPRFDEICRGCGLVDYWRRSGHWADFPRAPDRRGR